MTDISRQLQPHVTRLASVDLGALVREGGARDSALQWQAGPVRLDARHQRLDTKAIDALFALVEAARLDDARAALFGGDIVNPTEQRPALHTALRDASAPKDRDLAGRIEAARSRTAAFFECLPGRKTRCRHREKSAASRSAGSSISALAGLIWDRAWSTVR